MEVLTAPGTLRYIASEGAAPAPRGLRLHVYRCGPKVFLTLNGITMAVHDNGGHHILPLQFTKMELGVFSGKWTSVNTFDVQFVSSTVKSLHGVPVGLSVNVSLDNGFENNLVAVPQLQCSGVFINKNCIRLLFPSDSSIKACIRNPQFAVHSSHESVAEFRSELLPRVLFHPNKCTLSVNVNEEQHQTVCQYMSVLMSDTGIWRRCFKAKCLQSQSTPTEPMTQSQEGSCLVTL